MCDFMEHSRTQGSLGALLSASIALIGGKRKEYAIRLSESVCGYTENTCKNTNQHLLTWSHIICGKTKHKERDSGSDCHCRKLDIGQEEKMKTN